MISTLCLLLSTLTHQPKPLTMNELAKVDGGRLVVTCQRDVNCNGTVGGTMICTARDCTIVAV